MDTVDLFSIVNAPSGSLTPASAGGRGVALANAFLSPGGVPVEVSSSTLSVQPVQWGPSLVLIRDHTKICGGQYGVKKNNCFCCVEVATKKDCPGRHVLVKHRLTSSDDWVRTSRVYFHKGTTSGAVCAEPSVDVSLWKEEDIATLLGKQFASWNDWKEEALVLSAAGASQQQAVGVRTAVKVSKKLPFLKLGNADENVVVNVEGTLRQIGMDDHESSSKESGSWFRRLVTEPFLSEDESAGLLPTIHKVNILHHSIISLGDGVEQKIKELQVGIGIRLNDLELQVGSCPRSEEGSQLEGASVWNVLDDLQLQFQRMKSPTHVEETAKGVLGSSAFGNYSTTIKDAFKAVMQRVLPMETKLNDFTSQSGSTHPDWNWLKINEPSTTVREGGKMMDDQVQSLADRVGSLEMAIGASAKGDSEDVLVSFMGIRFTSEDDVRSYVESINGGSFAITAGVMTDCYAIFHDLNREIFDSKGKLSMVDLAKVSSLGTRQADVYHLLAAAEHGLPEFFDSTSSSGKIYLDGKQGKKHRFNNIASYEIWGPVGTVRNAVRRLAEVQLTRFVKTKRIVIQEVANPELSSFLNAMLNTSKEFVEAVFSFLTEEYSALAEHFNDAALCWDFACSCIEHVFKYEFEAARAVITNPDVSDTNIHSKVLWQSLRTIAVQESFLRVGFKNHSSLASAYSRFLLTQYQKTALELAKVSKESDTYKNRLMELEKVVETLDKRVRGAEGTASAAKNAMERLSKKEGRNTNS